MILSLNYQPRRIEEIFGEGEGLGIRVRYVVEPMPLGTGGAIRYAGDSLTESVVVFNGDVLTQIDLAAVLRLHRERKAKATIVLTPVDNPRAYGLVETDRDGNIQRFLEKPGEDEITCNTINAGIYVLEPDTFDRIPKDTAWSIERSFFPSLIERGETFVAYVYDGYWIDIGTQAKYMQVHHDIMDGRYSAPPFNGRPSAWVSPDARVEEGVEITGPCFIDEGAVIKKGARILPYSVIGKQTHVEEGADRRRIDHLAERLDRARRVDQGIDPRAQLPRRPQRHHRIPRGPRRQDRDYRLQQNLMINPNIFKAYDVRGLYPQEVNEDAARLIGRGFVAFLGAKRIAVSRDMRLSSPSMAAAFIDGATLQGADVVDYGMMGTDMLYFAVARDGHDGGVQITASHNPKEYNGIKMVRQEAFPLSGESGIGDIRDMIAAGKLPPPAATRGTVTTKNVVDDYVKHVLSFIDLPVLKPFNVVLDAGSGMAGMVAPLLFEHIPTKKLTTLCFEVDGTFPNHEANPLIEENRRDITERVIAEKADIGIAWDGDADRVLLPRRRRRVRRRRLHHGAARRGVPDQEPRPEDRLRRPRQLRGEGHGREVRQRGADEPRRPRVLQEADARRQRHLRRRGHRALLLPRQLLRRQRLHPGAADPRADVAQGQDPARAAGAAAREVLHLRRDQHQGRRHARRRWRRSTASPRSTRTATSTRWTASRPSSPTGTSTSAARTPSRCSG